MSGTTTIPSHTAMAIVRLGDAVFQCAKEMRAENKLTTRQIELTERMCAMQETNLKVTKALEEQLIMQQTPTVGPYADAT